MNNTLSVNVKRTNKNAVIPKYATIGDAGMDLVAVSKHTDMINNLVIYDTGLAFEIPAGYVGLVFPRSSIRKYDLELANSVGVIDCVPAGTLIQMDDGSVLPVEDIFNNNDFQIPIKSFNEDLNQFETDYIDEMWIVDGLNLIEIEDMDGDTIILPETKQIYTSNGWKPVKDLTDSDLLLKYD